jgi:hypothetical protein
MPRWKILVRTRHRIRCGSITISRSIFSTCSARARGERLPVIHHFTHLYPCRLYPPRFVPQFLGHGDHPIRTLDSKELRAQIKRVKAASEFLRSQNRKHSLRIGCTLSGGALLAAFSTLCAAWGLQGSTTLCLCSSAATWRTELPLLPMSASALPALPGKRHFSRSGGARPLPCNTLSGASYPRFPILARGNSCACLG